MEPHRRPAKKIKKSKDDKADSQAIEGTPKRKKVPADENTSEDVAKQDKKKRKIEAEEVAEKSARKTKVPEEDKEAGLKKAKKAEK